MKMTIPDHFEIEGDLKYAGVQSGSIKWKSGSIAIARCKSENDWKLDIFYSTVIGRPTRTYWLKTELKKITLKTRLILDFCGRNATTLHFKASNQKQYKELERILLELQQILLKGSSDTGQNAEVCSSPGRKFPSASPFRSCTINNSPFHVRSQQTSPQQFTSVKSNPNKVVENTEEQHIGLFSSDEDEAKENQNQNGGPQKFLQRAMEKSRDTLQPLGTSGFYSSTPAANRSFGLFSTYSSSKRPGLMPDPTPTKRARLSENINYSWNKHKLTPQQEKKQQSSLQGFSNLGNTCYMNAILQSLFGLDTFTADVLQGGLKMKKLIAPESLFSSLQKLLMSRKKNVLEIEKRDLLKNVKASITAKRFSGYLQHDAHELMSQVLDQMKDEVVKMAKATPSPQRDTTEPDPTCMGQEFVNPTVLNFEFDVLHSITCTECSEVVTKAEQFHDLSLDLPRRSRDISISRSIQDALDLYFRKEQIEYTCSKCGCSKAEVSHTFFSLPRVLVMHLKRYSYDLNISRHTKMGQDIQIPRFLTLQSHCEEGTTLPCPPTLSHNNSLQSSLPVSDDPMTTPRRKLNYGASGQQFQFKSSKPVTEESDDEISTKDGIMDLSGAESDRRYSEKAENRITMEEEEDPDLVKALELSLREAEQAQMYRNIGEDDDTYEKALQLSRLEEGKEKEANIAKLNEEDNFEKVLTISLMETKTSDNSSDQTGYSDKELNEMSEEDQIRLAIEKSLVDSCPYPVMDVSQNEPDILHECSKSVLNASLSVNSSANVCDKNFSLDETQNSEMFHDFSNTNTNLFQRSGTSSLSKPLQDTSNNTEASCDRGHSSGDCKAKTKSSVPHTDKEDFSDEDFDYCYLTGLHDGNHKDTAASTKADNILSDQTSQNKPQKVKETTLSLPENLAPPSNLVFVPSENSDLNKDISPVEKTAIKVEPPAAREGSLNLSCDETDTWLCLEDKENEFPRTPRVNQNTSNSENRVDFDISAADSPELPKVENEKGDLPFSYRLVSIVNHIGSSSIAGHYVSDVYDITKGSWFSFDDSHVSKTTESDVRSKRERSGYIFFYLSKNIFDDLKDHYALIQSAKKTE